MTFLLKQIYSLLKLLNSDTGHVQIAAGVACGLILGFAPAFSLQTVLVFLILFFFRIQIGAALLAAALFKFIAWMLDPAFHFVGAAVLETDGLRPLFTELYNMPIVPFTRFYNSITMGAGVISIVLALPTYFAAKALIIKYRVTVLARIQETKLWKAWKATAFYDWYAKYESIHGQLK